MMIQTTKPKEKRMKKDLKPHAKSIKKAAKIDQRRTRLKIVEVRKRESATDLNRETSEAARDKIK